MLRLAALALLAAGMAFCQGGSELEAVPLTLAKDKLPEFDVANIEVSKSVNGPRAQFLPGGKVQFEGLPLKFMVLAAWGFENDEGRISGGPAWLNSEKFDIVAKAPPDSKIATLRLMLRSLLITRFGMEAHIEDKMFPVYALVQGKGTPKVKASSAGTLDCKRGLENDVIMMTCTHMTMDELANGLRGMAPAYVDKPVLNRTELPGAYDFKLGWTPRGRLLGAGENGGAANTSAAPDLMRNAQATAGGMTIFEGIEKMLGLKMESTKHAMPVIVVDKINRAPVEN